MRRGGMGTGTNGSDLGLGHRFNLLHIRPSDQPRGPPRRCRESMARIAAAWSIWTVLPHVARFSVWNRRAAARCRLCLHLVAIFWNDYQPYCYAIHDPLAEEFEK